MKFRSIVFLMLIALPSLLFAQSGEAALDKIKGTYQIQVIDLRGEPQIPVNLAELVSKNRKQKETVFIKLGTDVRLKIPSYEEISKPGFLELKPVAHITREQSQKDETITAK